MKAYYTVAIASVSALLLGCNPGTKTETQVPQPPETELTAAQKERLAHDFVLSFSETTMPLMEMEASLTDFVTQLDADSDRIDETALAAFMEGVVEVYKEVGLLRRSVRNCDDPEKDCFTDWSDYVAFTPFSESGALQAKHADKTLEVKVNGYPVYFEEQQYTLTGSFKVDLIVYELVNNRQTIAVRDLNLSNNESNPVELKAEEAGVELYYGENPHPEYWDEFGVKSVEMSVLDAMLSVGVDAGRALKMKGEMDLVTPNLDWFEGDNTSKVELSFTAKGAVETSAGSAFNTDLNLTFDGGEYYGDDCIGYACERFNANVQLSIELLPETQLKPALLASTEIVLGYSQNSETDGFGQSEELTDAHADVALQLTYGDRTWGLGLGSQLTHVSTEICEEITYGDGYQYSQCDYYDVLDNVSLKLKDITNTQQNIEASFLVHAEMNFDLNLVTLGYITVDGETQATLYLDNVYDRVFADFTTLADVTLIREEQMNAW